VHRCAAPTKIAAPRARARASWLYFCQFVLNVPVTATPCVRRVCAALWLVLLRCWSLSFPSCGRFLGFSETLGEMDIVAPTVAPTRYRCAYPGCEKRYSSTDGVRKHAKKAHHSWIKSIDALLEGGGRQAMLEGAGLSKPSTYSIMESSGMESSGMEPDKANEPAPLTTTVKRLSSTGDVLLEQVLPDADQIQDADGRDSHWPWANPGAVTAEDAFHGSDGGLSCVTLEAESHGIDPALSHAAPPWFAQQEVRVSRMSSFHEVLPHPSLT
jgi:hypothetical protein